MDVKAFKRTIGMIVAGSILLVTVGYILISLLVRDVRDDFETRVANTNVSLNRLYAVYLVFNTSIVESDTRVLADVNQSLQTICVYNSAKEIIFRYNHQKETSTFRLCQDKLDIEDDFYQQNLYQTFTPILSDNSDETLGYLYAVYSTEEVDSIYNFSLALLFIAALVIILVMTPLTYLYHHRQRNQELERRKTILESEVEARTKDISELLEQKETILVNVSHEIKTPLALMRGSLDLLRREHQQLKNDDSMVMMERNVTRLERFIQRLLDISRARNQVREQKQVLNIKQTAELIASEFMPQFHERNINFKTNLETGLIEAPALALESIVMNLLSNAVKYTNSNGIVRLTGSMAHNGNGKYYSLTCRNTGQGISRLKQETIFNRFERGIKMDDMEGTGVGLAIVKELVEQLGGSIEVSSTPDIDTIFYIKLPLATEDIPLQTPEPDVGTQFAKSTDAFEAEVAESENELDEASQKETILIVDDNQDMLVLLQQLLRDYQTITAEDGEKGFNLAKEQMPDLIISDVMMPKMDGFELCEKLIATEETSHIPVIMLSARDDANSKLSGLTYGAIDYIGKPFNSEELIRRIENIFRLKQQMQKDTLDVQMGIDKSVQLYSEADQRFLDRINRLMEKHYSRNDFTVSELAHLAAVSERQMLRKVQALLGVKPNEYLNLYRLNKAKELLISGKSIGLTADEVGFKSQSHFSRNFKKSFDVSPSEFQAERGLISQ